VASVEFSVTTDVNQDLVLMLNYRISDGESIQLPIRLQTTAPHFGGTRWWLTCPLTKAGKRCERKVTELHLRNRLFGCRHCLELTYWSCKQAHVLERIEAMLRNFKQLRLSMANNWWTDFADSD